MFSTPENEIKRIIVCSQNVHIRNHEYGKCACVVHWKQIVGYHNTKMSTSLN